VLYIKAGTTNMAGAWFIHRPVRPVRGLYGPCEICVLAAAWRSGNIVGRINEVTPRRARLVGLLGWVTVFGGQTTSVFHQATQANSASYPQWDGK